MSDKTIIPVEKTEERQNLDIYLTIKNLTITPTIEADTTEMILNYTKEGLGIGYLPLEIAKKNNDLKIIELNENLPEIKLSILYDEESLTKASKELLNILIKTEESKDTL